jgi:glycosyltransferase involved in cell wall biosynthesis
VIKIGVMLRALDQKGGVGVYSQNLMDHLLEIDRTNQYVLYYAKPKFVGRYGHHRNVQERFLRAPNKAVWDQVAVPRAAKRDEVEVLFHTKFTVPLLTRCRTVMAIHGASWFVAPELYGKLDVMYVRAVMPLYCRKADGILSNSQLTTDDHIRILGVSEEKIKTILLAADDSFKKITDPAELEATRQEYDLPERFMLSVVKHDPRKNVPNLLESFRICRQSTECKLVVVGIGCEKYREECGLVEKGIDDDVIFLGWVANKRLPALYNLADFLFFPSVYEEFGIPTVEAMACGTPVVVSRTGALPELAGDAGLLVDPDDPTDMAEAIRRMWTDDMFRAEMAQRASLRAEVFGWDKCARQTLALLEDVAGSSRATPAGAVPQRS